MRFECIAIGHAANAGFIGHCGISVVIEIEGDCENLIAFGIEFGGIDFKTTTVGVGCCNVVALEFLTAVGGEVAARFFGQFPNVHSSVVTASYDCNVGVYPGYSILQEQFAEVGNGVDVFACGNWDGGGL